MDQLATRFNRLVELVASSTQNAPSNDMRPSVKDPLVEEWEAMGSAPRRPLNLASTFANTASASATLQDMIEDFVTKPLG